MIESLGRISFSLLASLVLLSTALVCSASPSPKQQKLLKRLKLPAGFSIQYFATNVDGARSLALGKRGTVFVSTRNEGSVYALIDNNRDGIADKMVVIASGLNMPNGIAFRNGDLYVAEVHRILKFGNIEQSLDKLPKPVVVYNKLPHESHHGWRYIRFGPDGKLYFAIGAPCNICNKKGYANISRLDLKTGKTEVVARGVRNSVGFDFRPGSDELWFTDNGRDLMGDDIPADEINRVRLKSGKVPHFGYPFCHGGNVEDPHFGSKGICSRYKKPIIRLGAHVAPLGLRFYTGRKFPANFRNGFFVAEHGSWNRSRKSGYRVIFIPLKNRRPPVPVAFVTGWLKGEKTLGRPVDFLNMPDGSLLVSDDYNGVIYRIRYH